MFWVLSLSPRYISAPRLPPGKHSTGIRSLAGGGIVIHDQDPSSALPPVNSIPRLYQNIFRGEPAISELDWPFTPTLKSSQRFSTHTGSVLHRLLRRLQPAQG